MPFNKFYQQITPKEFEKKVQKNQLPCIVVLDSGERGSSALLHLVTASLASEFKNKIDFYYIDADNSQDLFTSFSFPSLPVFLFYNEGDIVQFLTGPLSKSKLKSEASFLLDMSYS